MRNDALVPAVQMKLAGQDATAVSNSNGSSVAGTDGRNGSAQAAEDVSAYEAALDAQEKLQARPSLHLLPLLRPGILFMRCGSIWAPCFKYTRDLLLTMLLCLVNAVDTPAPFNAVDTPAPFNGAGHGKLNLAQPTERRSHWLRNIRTDAQQNLCRMSGSWLATHELTATYGCISIAANLRMRSGCHMPL